MANHIRDVLWSVVGRRKAGSDVTKLIKDHKGRSGNGIPWTTTDRWVKEGFLSKDGSHFLLTQKAVDSKKKGA